MLLFLDIFKPLNENDNRDGRTLPFLEGLLVFSYLYISELHHFGGEQRNLSSYNNTHLAAPERTILGSTEDVFTKTLLTILKRLSGCFWLVL